MWRQWLLNLLALLSLFVIVLIGAGMLLNKFKYSTPLTIHESVDKKPLISAVPKHKQTERILVLDGGGAQGIVELQLLAELERLSGKKINQLFDMVVGASTGSVIGTYLTIQDHYHQPKFSPNQLLTIYSDNLKHVLGTSKTRAFFTLSGLVNGLYSVQRMHHLFSRYLGDQRLDQSIVPIMVPTFCAQHNRLMFFKSWCTNTTCDKNSFSGNFVDADVATTSAAIPIIFNPVYIYGDRRCSGAVDSAVFINDPAFYVLPIIDQTVKAKRYILVDLGVSTQTLQQQQASKYQRFTGLFWLKHFISINVSINSRQTKQLLESRFFLDSNVTFWYLHPNLAQCDDPLDVSQDCVDYLNHVGKQYGLQKQAALKMIAKQLEN